MFLFCICISTQVHGRVSFQLFPFGILISWKPLGFFSHDYPWNTIWHWYGIDTWAGNHGAHLQGGGPPWQVQVKNTFLHFGSMQVYEDTEKGQRWTLPTNQPMKFRPKTLGVHRIPCTSQRLRPWSPRGGRNSCSKPSNGSGWDSELRQEPEQEFLSGTWPCSASMGCGYYGTKICWSCLTTMIECFFYGW